MKTTHALLGLLVSATACSAGGSDPGEPDAGEATVDAVPFSHGVGTLAGAAEAGNADGDRAVARFANPVNVIYADGLLYVADFDNGRLRTVDAAGNVATLIDQVGFTRPFGLALSPTGTLYVQTDDNPGGMHSGTTGTVWRVDRAARAAIVIAADLGRPRGLAVLADGRIAMADYVHHVIRLLQPATGATTVLAGTTDAPGYVDAVGAAARFSQPYGIAVRSDGTLVVADYGNNRLRLVTVGTGTTTTLAGTGVAGFADGDAATAELDMPQGVAIDLAGDIYITDSGNFRVRRLRGTTVDTIAGNGRGGYLDADDRLAAELYGLEGLAVAPDGATLYVADGTRGEVVPYNRVRFVEMTP